MKRTRWFPVTTPPKRRGFYEMQFVGYPATWNPMVWFNGTKFTGTPLSVLSIDHWRGLTKEHKA